MLYANRYEHVRPLGHGATGSVELVSDSKTGRKCALKLLRLSRRTGKTATLEGFQREFEILKELSHPHIARVYDAGYDSAAERFYISTEYCSGIDLYKATENLDIEHTEEIFVQTLRALNYLHIKEIFHLDIKPQNILVAHNDDGTHTAKIIDFGFANYFDNDFVQRQKAANSDNVIIIGTPAYTAPEIISGNKHDGRTDLYSLACVFYEALTRKLPFRSDHGDPREVHFKHLNYPPVPLTEINNKIPPYLNDILLKMMNKAPEDRFINAQEVIKEINLHKATPYDVETTATRMSYLLGQGRLVGRHKELAKFRDCYFKRIHLEDYKYKPFLIVTGQSGCGKSRFLQECKYEVQRDFGTDVITWTEFNKTLPEDLKTPCLVIGDDVEIKKIYISKLNIAFNNTRILTILTTSQKEIPCDEENIIRLSYFTKEEVAAYLDSTLGIKDIPESIVNDLYKYTNHGCPLYLVQFLKAAFANNYLIDSHGRWSANIFNDLVSELKTKGFTDFIKQDLVKKLEDFNFTEDQLDLMYTMALTNKPTLTDLREITCGHLIEDQLGFFVEQGILRTDPELNFVFSNPLYKEIFIGMMPEGLKKEYCDRIADHLEANGGSAEEILYFRGRGSGNERLNQLFRLASLKRANHNHDESIENLMEILKNDVEDKDFLADVYLLLGDIYIEQGDCERANFYLDKIVSLEGIKRELTMAKAYEQKGLCWYRKKNYEESTISYLKALTFLSDPQKHALMVVGIKNRMALNKISVGNIEQSNQLALEALNIWNEFAGREKLMDLSLGESDIILYNKGEYQRAIVLLEQQLKSLEDKKHLELYPSIIYRLGIFNVKVGHIDEGQRLLEDCLRLVKEHKVPYWIYGVYNELGVLAERKRDYQKAAEYYQHSLELAQKTVSVKINVFISAFNLARTLSAINNLSEAKKHFEYIINNIENLKDEKNINRDFILIASHIEMAGILRREGEYDKGGQILEKAVTYFKDKEHLKHYEQYYLQELVLNCLDQNKSDEHKKAAAQLEKIKNQQWFNNNDYEFWKSAHNL
ncbi:MAG: protein kinase [Deltaproteobacteria bacterium]|nr:protein kinase [Deltaproteobacteria bacterium]